MPGKTKSTIMIDSDLWKRLRVVAILNEFEISELVEEALREKLARMQQQPEQDPAYRDVENVRYKPKGLDQKPEIFESDIGDIPLKDLAKSEFPVYLPGVKFPIKRAGLIEIVNSLLNEFQQKYHKKPLLIEHSLHMLKKLQDAKLYKNKESLSDDLVSILNKEKTLNEEISINEPLKMHGCNIITEFKDVEGRDIKIELMETLNKIDNKMRKSVKERQLATY